MESEDKRTSAEDENESSTSLAELFSWARGLLFRRRWLILAAFLLVVLVGSQVVSRLPKKYESEATLVYVRQRVAQRYVDPSGSGNSDEEIYGITREVLSRKRCLEIISALGLYRDSKETAPDALIERFRKDITIDPLRSKPGSEVSAFRVMFVSTVPGVAQDVVMRVCSLFIEENLRAQSEQTNTTAKFISQQLEIAKQRLDEQEAKVRNFKVRNLGNLPEQQSTNLLSLNELRLELQAVEARANRAKQQRSDVETSLNGFIAKVDNDRNALLTRFTPRHSEVVKKDRDSELARGLLQYLRTGVQKAELSKPLGIDDAFLDQLRNQIKVNLYESETAVRDEQRLRDQIAKYQSALAVSPLREQELAELRRDYETTRQQYNELLSNQLRYQQTLSIEEQRQGAHYRLVDPPSLPNTPSSPNLKKLGLGLLGAGLALGLLLALLTDLLNSTYRSEVEVRKELGIPLVIGFPVVVTAAEIRTTRLVRLFELVIGFALLVGAAAVVKSTMGQG